MAQQSDSNIIMTTFETLGGVTYQIRVWQTDDGGFSPEAFNLEEERSVYLGGEDDEDDETPEAAIEHGLRLLREQHERGALDAEDDSRS